MFKWFRNVAIERELTDILDRHQQVLRDADISRTSETAHCPLTSAVA